MVSILLHFHPSWFRQADRTDVGFADDQALDANGQPLYGTQDVNGDEYYEEEPVYDDAGYPTGDYHEEQLYVEEGYEAQPVEVV